MSLLQIKIIYNKIIFLKETACVINVANVFFFLQNSFGKGVLLLDMTKFGLRKFLKKKKKKDF